MRIPCSMCQEYVEAESAACDHSEPKEREPVNDGGVREPGSASVLMPQLSRVTWEGQPGYNSEMYSWKAMAASYWHLGSALDPQFIPFWDVF